MDHNPKASTAGWQDDPNHWLVIRAARGDTEAAAAFQILAQPHFAPRVASWIGAGLDTGSIWFDRMLNEYAWSSGERALLELAHHLWNSSDRTGVDLDYLLSAVDDAVLYVALSAMWARHGRPFPTGGGVL